MTRVLLTTTLLAALGGAAHATGWLLLCPRVPSAPLGDPVRQIRAYDTAAQCEAERAPFEKRCASDARRKPLGITCDCTCTPARTCN